MSFSEYKLVYNTLNHDKTDIIDFQKFCLINIDKSNDVDRMI